MKNLAAYVRLLRPEQWAKNSLVLTALLFSRHLFDAQYVLTAVAASASFILGSSAVYILNDVLDRSSDATHPVKRFRPIASGQIPSAPAIVLSLLLSVAATALAAGLNTGFMLIVLGYILLNIAYSVALKRVPLVDVFIIAAGFMLRVVGGAQAIAVEISPWLILCTMFLSLFLGFSKRRGEFVIAAAVPSFHPRSSTKGLDLNLLDGFVVVAASGVAISYSLYTVSERTVTMFGTEHLLYTTIFVLFGIFRFMTRSRTGELADNPTAVLVRDPVIIINILLYVFAVWTIIYWAW